MFDDCDFFFLAVLFNHPKSTKVQLKLFVSVLLNELLYCLSKFLKLLNSQLVFASSVLVSFSNGQGDPSCRISSILLLLSISASSLLWNSLCVLSVSFSLAILTSLTQLHSKAFSEFSKTHDHSKSDIFVICIYY